MSVRNLALCSETAEDFIEVNNKILKPQSLKPSALPAPLSQHNSTMLSRSVGASFWQGHLLDAKSQTCSSQAEKHDPTREYKKKYIYICT